MLRAAARRLSGAAASISPRGGVESRCAAPSLARRARAFASEPHNDDWEANFEDLMAMEDSYGSGVEDLSSAAAELANARMAEQKKLQEEMRRLRGIQPGDRVKVRVRLGAPYPEVVKRFHYASPFGGAGLGHAPGGGGGADEADAFASTETNIAETSDASNERASPSSSSTPGAKKRPNDDDGVSSVEKNKKPAFGASRRWKMGVELGYVVCVRGERVGVKRNGHPEDTASSYPTYPKDWVEVLDVGEMWEMKTGPRNLGAFASDEDYAQAQKAWAEATMDVKAARAAGKE
jgi:hypothetical protein